MLGAGAPTLAAPATADHGAALAEGSRLATFSGRAASSADVLLGLLRAGGAAARLLGERGVTAARLEGFLAQVRAEPAFDLGRLVQDSHEIAQSLGARQTSSLHLLHALLRGGGAAVDLLRLGGQEPTRLRPFVLRALTGPGRTAERARSRVSPGGNAGGYASGPTAGTPAPVMVPRSEPVATPPVMPRSEPPALVARSESLAEPSVVPRSEPVGAPVMRARSEPGAALTRSEASAAPVVCEPPSPPPVPSRMPPQVPAAVAPTPHAQDAFAPAGGDVVVTELVPLEAPSSPVLYREREVGRLLDLLQARGRRVVCIVGEPGAGRSSVAAALASSLADTPLCPVGAPAGGMSPGMWLDTLHRQAPPGAPIVIDGCGVLGAEGGDGPGQLLATARAGRRWVLTATPADLRRLELGAPDLAAALERVVLSPLNPDALFEVVETALGHMAATTDVEFSADVCKALLRLSPRYPSDLAQPGRAITIAGIAAARTLRLGQRRVTEEAIAEVVAAAADIPAARLLRSDDDRFRTLEDRLAERVVGHDDARARIADVLRRSYAGFRGGRPLASFLLLGPTGVGKTETARAIADALFDGESALVRIDLSEFNEPHTVARLIGSPPGYVGHEEGGQLTEALRRRPASVVLLDELEKAHREVLLTLLQVLEDGRLTDGRGRTVDFSAAAIVMTSNLGAECYKRTRTPPASTILGLARSRLPPELWNRIDEVLCYAPLKEPELRGIVARFARDSARRLEAERGIGYHVEDAVLDAVLEAETDRSLGARPLRRAFERLVEGPIAAKIVAGGVPAGTRLRVTVGRRGEIGVSVER